MKLGKRVLSMFLVILFIFNCFIPVNAARGDILILTDDIFNAVTDVEYGSAANIYKFDDSILSGVALGDEVYLAADAVYTSTEAGIADIELTNFRLEGSDAGNYILPSISEPVRKQINITKKVIRIAPAKTYIYYGQDKPDFINDIADYSDQIVNGDEVNITAQFVIQSGSEVRNDYSIAAQNISCDNDNYTVELDDTVNFEVREYISSETAVTEKNDYAGEQKAILNAPYGFLICNENRADSQWSSSIEIDLMETQNGTASYYLRCDDSSNDEYKAISNEKIYNYTSIQTLPEIESIWIEKTDEDSSLNLLPFGVFGNGSVKVTVEAVGTTVEQQTTIYLGEDNAYDYEIAASELREDGRYYYTAEFTYDVPDDDMLSLNLKAYAENSSGRGSDFCEFSGLSDVENSNKTVASVPLILKKDESPLEEELSGAFKSNNHRVSCSISIDGIESGIAKIEYGWDIDRSFCDDEKNFGSGHYCGFKQNNYTDQYVNYNFSKSEVVKELDFSLRLEFDDSVWAKYNHHMLFIRVTDNCGNVRYGSIQDSIGSDMLPPNITGVEIRKAEVSAVESILRFLSFGIFSNDSVEIAITADDNESINELPVSGIASVSINGRNMQINDNGEYILTVKANDILETMQITVKDKAGWTTIEAVRNIYDETGMIKSNNLIVENDEPEVSWNFSSAGHIDRYGAIWYGKNDISETIKITASDTKGSINSGLYSFKITDNSDTLFERKVFSSETFEDSKTYTIGDFADGAHIIEAGVEDNAGNINMEPETRVFYVDCIPPENVDISVISPDYVEIDSKQWFDKDDVIAFRVESSDDSSGLKSISVNINEQLFVFEDDEIISDESGTYVIVDTSNIAPDSQHKYTITGVATDIAGNSSILKTFTVYKDFENPVINEFTIGKKSEAIDKILNVLTFGAYSNDTVILKAYVSDAEYDSGIDYVTVDYDGLSEPIKMKNEGDGVFSVEISIGEEVFESDITVTAYDKYGKSSVTCPNIENADSGSAADNRFVMTEIIKPGVTLNLPAGDGIIRNDGQIWYKSNKQIELKVQDEHSGIRNIDFTINGVDITADKNEIDLLKADVTENASVRNTDEQYYNFDTDYFTDIIGEPEDGKYSIEINITDNAGNIKHCEKTYYVDKTAPQVDKIEFTPLTADGIKETDEFIEKMDYGFYFKTDFELTLYISDELPSSGLNEVRYRFVSYQNGVKQEETAGSQKISDGIAKLTVPKGFKGQIFVEAFDNVLNRSGEKTTKAYVVDNTAPEINIIKNVSTPYHDANGNNLYVVDNSITIEVIDMVSGIKEIGYSQKGEQNSYDRKTVAVSNTVYNVGDSLGDGWIVSEVDINLVTKVTKTFSFNSDDNDVVLTFDASDNALNRKENIKSEKFTIDKTSPVINVSFRASEGDDVYYNQNRIADITVIDRNFDEDLIKVAIENQFGLVPSFSFTERSKTEHTAVIEFDEGDYTFDVTGTDLGNHTATVNFSGGNEKLFFVDKTSPVIEENFASFTNVSTENSFNSDKTVDIRVTEHNFAPDLIKLRITRKAAGTVHNTEDFVDVTSEVLESIRWNDSGDVHTISFTLSQDAVYRIEITPSDLAGNDADYKSTAVFEIDKTVPVVKAKNGILVGDYDTEFLDIYTYSRKDEPAPVVEFEDLNIDHINYVLTVYIPDYSSSEAAIIVKPVRIYLEEDTDKSGQIKGNKFVLPDFVKDGVYALELTAVDSAGNESLMNVNTYVRMVDQEVLAYIMESNAENKTGLYSFQYESGEAISKRPDDFSDIKIFVLAKKDTGVDIVLRDNNGEEFNTNAQAVTDDSVYGMNIYNFTLKSDYFKDNFQDDTDMELHLTVKNEDSRIDLGRMHIDNIAPDCDIPEEFRSWKWYFGEDKRTITLSNISELVDEGQCKVYDNGNEISFKYSGEDNTIEFTLEKGWHNVGIILNDMAGNAYNIQEKTNIHIGYFWLWVIIGVSVTLTGTVVYTLIRSKKRRQLEKE